MGFFTSFLGILGFVIGSVTGLAIGFFFFIYSRPKDVEDPVIKPLHDLDITDVEDLISDIPYWIKNPDYDRVDWLNKFIVHIWPFLEKEISSRIRSIAEPMFSEYIGQFMIKSIEFEKISTGTLPPTIHGLKVYETNEKELVMEPAIKWAGNPSIILAINLTFIRITVQLVDLQVFAAPRITLKPLVPIFPCFSNAVVSLMEKPHFDFGLKVFGGDIMSIPGLYRYIQETIKKEVAKLYMWPQFLEIPILDPSTVAATKPVGVLNVKVVSAKKLLKKDLIGQSDPYVKLSLSGDRLPARKTSIKKKTLNPVWNEDFKLIVKDPHSQFLVIDVYDWDKVGGHDKLGSQVFPLKVLTPNEMKEVNLDLLKSTDISLGTDHKKPRGLIVLNLTYAPFREDIELDRSFKKLIGTDRASSSVESPNGAGILMASIYGAENVEGSRHTNPYVVIIFKGEKKKSKVMKRSRDPLWNEEFQFMIEEPPISERLHIQVMSRKRRFGFPFKEKLGHVDIYLDDVVHNGRINEKYHLIDSKNGVIHVELRWKNI